MAQMRKQQGLSLVELMISVTLGLLLSLAVSQVMLGSRTSDNIQDALSQIQENARFAMHYMGKEIRMAGFVGCPAIDSVDVNTIALPEADGTLDGTTLLNIDNNVEGGNAYDAIAGSDILHIKRASDEFIRITGAFAPNSANIQVEDNSLGLEQGDFVVVSDCQNTDVFRVTNIPAEPGEGTATLVHGAGAMNSSSSLSTIYGGDSELFALEEMHFFVRDSGRKSAKGDAIYSLFVQQRTAGSGGAMGAVTELLEGVEDMQFQLGVDNDEDQSVDEYVTADAVVDWATVLSIKITLQLYGSNSSAVSGDTTQTFTNAVGQESKVTDGRMRRVFTNVFAIRNKLP